MKNSSSVGGSVDASHQVGIGGKVASFAHHFYAEVVAEKVARVRVYCDPQGMFDQGCLRLILSWVDLCQ